MELEEIEVVIAKDGTVHVQVRGVKGSACLERTKPLEEALGGQIEVRRLTHEAEEVVDVEDLRQRDRRGHDR